jgi:hypothetical protein
MTSYSPSSTGQRSQSWRWRPSRRGGSAKPPIASSSTSGIQSARRAYLSVVTWRAAKAESTGWRKTAPIISFVSLGVAVAALVFAIYYNEKHLDDAADAQDQAREALAIQLYTTVADRTEEALQKVALAGFDRLVSGKLRAKYQPAVVDALRELDHMALLFNRGILDDVPDAERRWRPYMTCAWGYLQREYGSRGGSVDPVTAKFLRRQWPAIYKMTGGEGDVFECSAERLYLPPGSSP